jgi:hypothetical protein
MRAARELHERVEPMSLAVASMSMMPRGLMRPPAPGRLLADA